MITRLQNRPVRRRLLAYGTAVLFSATIILTTLSVIGYARYQQLAAEARTASDIASEVEQFAWYKGFPVPNDGYLLDKNFPLKFLCTGVYTPGEGWEIVIVAHRESCAHIGNHTGLMTHDDNPLSPIDPFALCISFPYSKYHLRFVDTLDHQILADFAILSSDRGNDELIALTRRPIGDFDRIKGMDVLDESDKVVASFQARDTAVLFHFIALQVADDTAQVAKDAMKELVATAGGALLAFFAISTLGWIAARGRISRRRALQRQRETNPRIWQASGDKAWRGRLIMGLIASAVSALDHPDDQDRYREEWAADVEEIPSGWQRLRWALLLRLLAPMGIRSARCDELSMSPPQQQ